MALSNYGIMVLGDRELGYYGDGVLGNSGLVSADPPGVERVGINPYPLTSDIWPYVILLTYAHIAIDIAHLAYKPWPIGYSLQPTVYSL